MEDLNSLRSHLNDLKLQVGELTSAGLSLITLLTKESDRLSREDEALLVEALQSSIRQQLREVKLDEESASCGYSHTNLIQSLPSLVVGTIKAVSGNRQMDAVTNYFLSSSAKGKYPFGKVLVAIGPAGLPDDVRVVSISKLARESSRYESQIISELRQRGYLLLEEEAFSQLTNILLDAVRKGRLRLPIPRDKLSKVTLSRGMKAQSNKPE